MITSSPVGEFAVKGWRRYRRFLNTSEVLDPEGLTTAMSCVGTQDSA
jgi:hypothetical protein